MFSRFCAAAAPIIAAIWVGLILGVSFFAAPIKFTATGIGQEQLLAVGQVTFQAFTWIELATFVLLLGASLTKLSRGVVIGIVALGLLLLMQKFGILPGLDTELNKTVAGEAVDNTMLHVLYVVIDVVKLAVLVSLALLLRDKRIAP